MRVLALCSSWESVRRSDVMLSSSGYGTRSRTHALHVSLFPTRSRPKSLARAYEMYTHPRCDSEWGTRSNRGAGKKERLPQITYDRVPGEPRVEQPGAEVGVGPAKELAVEDRGEVVRD